jgi:hypothetical protein
LIAGGKKVVRSFSYFGGRVGKPVDHVSIGESQATTAREFTTWADNQVIDAVSFQTEDWINLAETLQAIKVVAGKEARRAKAFKSELAALNVRTITLTHALDVHRIT